MNPKKSNRVNYQASISEDENKVARALLNTVCATKYSLAVYMWPVSLARGWIERSWRAQERVVQCLESQKYNLQSNLSKTTGQLPQQPGTNVRLRADADPIVSHVESRCVNSWLLSFSIHQDIKIAIQQVWCNSR